MIRAAALVLVAGAATAQTVAEVQFDRGTSGTTINGSVTGHDYADYRLGASAGQTLTASLTVTGTNGYGTAYFNVLPPGSDDVAIFVGASSPDGSAEVMLPETGTYTIRVYLMGNDRDTGKTVGFALPVTIR